jgi:hypothetical protein
MVNNMEKQIKSFKNHKQPNNVLLVNQFRTGTEWSPGRPARSHTHTKIKPLQPDDLVIQKVEDVLINWFLHEQPKADQVSVVKNSLQLIDTAHDIWRAKVQTVVFFPTIAPRIHESSVRFRVICHKDKVDSKKDFYTIFHNHVIFPS